MLGGPGPGEPIGSKVCSSPLRERLGLASKLGFLAPLILWLSIPLLITALIVDVPSISRVLSLLALGAVLLGGLYEYYYMVLVLSVSSLASRGSIGFKVFLEASLVVATYIGLIGILLAFKLGSRSLEYIAEKYIHETECGHYYRPFIGLISLGLALASFQRCVAASMEALLGEACRVKPSQSQELYWGGGEETASNLGFAGL